MKKLKYEKPVLDVKLVLLEQVIASSTDCTINPIMEEEWEEVDINTGDFTMRQIQSS